MHATIPSATDSTPWTPNTEEERAAVLRQMDRLLNSRHFRNSKRYPALLEYIIRETLAGNAESLKERVLGMAVFHRPPDYDANADPIVRVTAGEIRKRIAQYYHEEDAAGEIQIDLRPDPMSRSSIRLLLWQPRFPSPLAGPRQSPSCRCP